MEPTWTERKLMGQANDLPDELIRELDTLDEERSKDIEELGRYLARSQPSEDEIQLVASIERLIAEKLGVDKQIDQLRELQRRRRSGDKDAS